MNKLTKPWDLGLHTTILLFTCPFTFQRAIEHGTHLKQYLTGKQNRRLFSQSLWVKSILHFLMKHVVVTLDNILQQFKESLIKSQALPPCPTYLITAVMLMISKQALCICVIYICLFLCPLRRSAFFPRHAANSFIL